MLGWYCIIRKPVWQTLALGGILGLVGRLVGLWLTVLAFLVGPVSGLLVVSC